MKTKKIEIWGGFHNQMTPIVVRVPADADLREQGLLNILSEDQTKRVQRHMCGIKGCLCGVHHGWKLRTL